MYEFILDGSTGKAELKFKKADGTETGNLDIKPQTSGSNNASLVVLGYTTPTVNLNVQSFSDNNGGYAEATLNGT
ncbi:MAG TPA: hypothetical protein DHW82_09530, partial [Spirochaetia bacterium]|nr:hypothetical protein [Spirochaetia bacterium]